MTHDPYDHGQQEVDCSTCSGLGQVVQAEIVHNPKTGRTDVVQRANVCRDCGGNKKVWI